MKSINGTTITKGSGQVFADLGAQSSANPPLVFGTVEP